MGIKDLRALVLVQSMFAFVLYLIVGTDARQEKFRHNPMKASPLSSAGLFKQIVKLSQIPLHHAIVSQNQITLDRQF